MPQDIEHLSESELIALNQRIISRLRQLRQIDAQQSMRAFRIGEKVSVRREGRPPLTGVVTRYNKTTVSIVTPSGQWWKVSPWLLQKAKGRRTSDARPDNVVTVFPKQGQNRGY
jgi:hypothetical protein